MHFAALEREADIVAARITGDDLEFGAEHRVDQSGKLVGVVAGAGRADGERLGVEIVKFGKAGRSERDADAHLVVGAADPGEFRGVELCAIFVEKRIERCTAANRADDGAVVRRRRIEIIGKAKTAGPNLPLHRWGGG